MSGAGVSAGNLALGCDHRRRPAGRSATPGGGPLLVPPRDAGDSCRGRRRSASALRERGADRRISLGCGSIGRGCIRERAISLALLSVGPPRPLWPLLHRRRAVSLVLLTLHA